MNFLGGLARILITDPDMPRRTPKGTGGLVFHVLNRGVRRMRLFDRPGDYRDFLDLLAAAQSRTPMPCMAYCLMPNHFHLVLRPQQDADLSTFMFWLTLKHSRRWHAAHATSGTGAVYQGRFKAIPVSADAHFLRLCRYVERNPVRSGLVRSAEDWPWSSLAQRLEGRQHVRLVEWPVSRPDAWLELVNGEDTKETEEIRAAVRRSSPYGPELWRQLLARRLGSQRSLRPIGRPRKSKPGFVFPVP
jgi:putative transposase